MANQKPLEEIKEMVKDKARIFVVGCSSCVAICFAGGRKEVSELSAALRLYKKNEGKAVKIEEESVLRQCEWEFIEPLKKRIEQSKVTLSMACGVGIQTLAEKYPEAQIYPAVDTTFMGMPRELGVFEENCAGCGSCILDKTAGICPIARCAKSLLNGPCGGAKEGQCEISKDIPCAWELIYERLNQKGQLKLLEEITQAKNWSVSMSGTPRKRVRPDLVALSKK